MEIINEQALSQCIRDALRAELQQHFKTAARIETSNKRYDDHKIQQQIDEVRKLLATMPKAIGVKNHHHFGKWSKSLIISVVVCFCLTVLSIGTTLHF
jgi:hypothetical protein